MQNKSHSTITPGGRTQIKRFSSDNQNSRYKKYVPPGGGGDGLTYSHDDNDDIKEEEKNTSFIKNYKNTYNPKYALPRGKNMHLHDDNDDLKEEEKSISFKDYYQKSHSMLNTDNSNNDDDLDVERISSSNTKTYTSGTYKFNANKFNHEKNHDLNDSYERKVPFSSTKSKIGSKPQFCKDKSIESVDDAIEELRWKQNPNIRKLDDKMYDELEKFDKIINFMINRRLGRDERVRLFIEICKTFSAQQLKESTNQMKKPSIYSIFFDNKKFKLSDHFKDVFIEIFQGNIKHWELKSIFEFFHALISISSKNAEMLNNDINLLKDIKFKSREIGEQVEKLIKYVEARKQDEIDSLESSVSPTPQDLFFC